MATLRPQTTTGWGAFTAWAICGLLWAFSFLSFVGLITLPLAVIATVLNVNTLLIGAMQLAWSLALPRWCC